MKIGAVIFATDYCIALTELAPALEERGFDSALRARTHPHPRQPALALAGRRGAAAGVFPHARPLRELSRRPRQSPVRSGSARASCLVTERDPIVTAKAVASLDLVSGGRFDFGIGAGWNAEEMRSTTAPASRPAFG